MRSIFEQLTENPVFLRNIRWKYRKRACGIPRLPGRIIWGASARFVFFALMYLSVWRLFGDEILPFWRFSISYAAGAVAARYARGFPVWIGTKFEPTAGLRNENREGMLTQLMLTPISSRDAFIGFAAADHLVFFVLIVEHIPLVWLVLTLSTGLGESSTLIILSLLLAPVVAADIGLHLLYRNLYDWKQRLGPVRLWSMLVRQGKLFAEVLFLFVYIVLMLNIWTLAGPLSVLAIEGVLAIPRIRYIRRTWNELADTFWDRVRETFEDTR